MDAPHEGSESGLTKVSSVREILADFFQDLVLDTCSSSSALVQEGAFLLECARGTLTSSRLSCWIVHESHRFPNPRLSTFATQHWNSESSNIFTSEKISWSHTGVLSIPESQALEWPAEYTQELRNLEYIDHTEHFGLGEGLRPLSDEKFSLGYSLSYSTKVVVSHKLTRRWTTPRL